MRLLMLGAQLFSKRLHLFLRRREFPLELIRRALQSLRVFDGAAGLPCCLRNRPWVPRTRRPAATAARDASAASPSPPPIPSCSIDAIFARSCSILCSWSRSFASCDSARRCRVLYAAAGTGGARRHASPSRGRESERGASLGQLAHLCLERLDELIVVG